MLSMFNGHCGCRIHFIFQLSAGLVLPLKAREKNVLKITFHTRRTSLYRIEYSLCVSVDKQNYHWKHFRHNMSSAGMPQFFRLAARRERGIVIGG